VPEDQKIQFNFPFPSDVIEDDQVSKIVFGTNTYQKNFSFSVRIKNNIGLQRKLLTVLDAVTDIPEEYFKNLVSYGKWFNTEILRLLEKNLGKITDAPEYEDIVELIERKNSLQEKLKLQLDYFNVNHHRIEEMRKKLYHIYFPYFGIQLSTSNDAVFFDALSPNGQIFLKLAITDGLEYTDESTYGNGFVEISKSFINALAQIQLDHTNQHNEITLSSFPNPGSIYLKTSSAESSKTISLSSEWLCSYQEFYTLEFLLHLNLIQSTETILSKHELVDIFTHLRNHKKGRVTLQVALNNTKTRPCSYRNGKIQLGRFGSSKTKSIEVQLNQNTLLFLQRIIHDATGIRLIAIGGNLATFFILTFGDASLTFAFREQSNFKSNLLDIILQYYSTNVGSTETSSDIFQDKQHIPISEVIDQSTGSYTKGVLDQLIPLLRVGDIFYDHHFSKIRLRKFVTDKQSNQLVRNGNLTGLAAGVAQTIRFKLEKRDFDNRVELSVPNFPFNAQISINNNFELINADCTCHRFGKRGKCEHTLGILVSVLTEGIR
jgi:hypothetical protein